MSPIIYWGLLAIVCVGVPLYRMRGNPKGAAAGVLIGLLVSAALLAVLTWAGTDLERLTPVAFGVGVVVAVLGIFVVGRWAMTATRDWRL